MVIIRLNGIVVGILDPQTMEDSEVKDPTLRFLLDEWKKDGFDYLIPTDEGIEGEESDSMTNIPYGIEAKVAIEDGLLAQGYDVQTE